jgi:sugar/nucleoside kinase (ribokinase family)
MSATFDILGLGCIAVDDLLYVESYPPPDTKSPVRRRERRCGGQTGNALIAAARLGARCAYAGSLGPDPLSEYVRTSLQGEGIDCSWLRQIPEARPIHSTIIVEAQGGTRTVLYDLDGACPASADWPDQRVIPFARVLYVDQFGIEGMLRAAKVAHDAAIPIVADFESDLWPGYHELVALVDHLILGEEFALKLTQTSDPASAVNALWTEDRRAVIVTCGPAGCWYRDSSRSVPLHFPAFPVNTMDSTGCGDVFHGAYATALAKGGEILERLRFASAAAALKAAHGEMPRRAEVLALINRP